MSLLYSTVDSNFKVGDSYIHFTKYGGVNRGIVKDIGHVVSIDTINRVDFLNVFIKNEKNISLFLDGSDGRIFKVVKEYTPEEANKLTAAMIRLKEKKNASLKRHEKWLEDNKDRIMERVNEKKNSDS